MYADRQEPRRRRSAAPRRASGVLSDVDEPVRDDKAAVTPRDHVELDEVDARLDRGAKRLERVLGRQRLRARGGRSAAAVRSDVRARSRRRPGRQVVLLEPSAFGRVRDDHAVGQPFDRRAIVGPRVRRRPRPGARSRASSSRSDARSSGPSASRRRSSLLRERLLEPEHDRVEAERGPLSTCGSSAASVPPTARTSRSSSGTDATLSATMPPGARCSLTSRKNSRVAR